MLVPKMTKFQFKLKPALYLLFIIPSSLNLRAQEIEKGDIVRLKNGKTIKGTIVKQQFGTLSINILDSVNQQYKTIVLQQGEITNIEQQTETLPESENNFDEKGNKNGQIYKKKANGNPVINSDKLGDLMITDQIQTNTINQFIQRPKENIIAPVIVDKPILTDIQSGKTNDDNFDPFSVPRPRRQPKLWNRDIKGYRGFVDYGYITGIGNEKNNRMEIATAHGYQFNPIFYIGVGATFHITTNKKDSSLPIFFNSRINFLDEYTTPFWDVRSGYSIKDGKGFYFSTAFGVSFTKKGKSAFNVGLNYTLQNAKYNRLNNNNEAIKFNKQYHGLGLRITYEY